MTETAVSAPQLDSAQEDMWHGIWARHCLFDESPLELRRHLRKQGVNVGVQEVRDAIEWGAENAVQVLSSRRLLRAKMATAIAARRKLVLNEIARLHAAQKARGGIEDTTREYDRKGKLQKTTVRVRDCSREILTAERCLAELDRFCVVADGLAKLDPNVGQVQRIEFDLKGFFESTYDDPDQPTPPKRLRAPTSLEDEDDETTPPDPPETAGQQTDLFGTTGQSPSE